jgi:nicotinate-nucleotide pyrophosphorylase (carboxylating)
MTEVPSLLQAAGLDPEAVVAVIRTALAEDLGPAGDITTLATVPADAQGSALAVSRASGVVAGLPVAAAVYGFVSQGRVQVEQLVDEGARVEPGTALLRVSGPVRDLLTAERTSLNLLTHLSGIATLTRRWVDAVAGTDVRIRDTRKTLPGLRALEKYAVRCGGGENYRMSLSDAALVKDNHVAAAGSVRAAFEAITAAAPGVPIEIEVDTVEQFEEAINAGAALVLLDNMSPELMTMCVRMADGMKVRTEASGGVTLANAAEVAATGVDYFAIGALTHSAPALDIGLDLQADPRS